MDNKKVESLKEEIFAISLDDEKTVPYEMFELYFSLSNYKKKMPSNLKNQENTMVILQIKNKIVNLIDFFKIKT